MSIAYTQLHRTSLRLQHAITYAQLDGPLKLLLKLICEHHNDELGYAWPGIERLALLACASERTVRRNLIALQEEGVLVIEHKGRMKHYFIQETALIDMAISDLQLSAERPQTWTPVSKTVTNETPNLDKNGTKVGHLCPHNRGEERKIGTEKRNGGGTDARATPPAAAPAPAPATPAMPEPASPPALFASHLEQPQQPTAAHIETAPTPAPAADASAFAHLVDRINAQRASNGKRAFALADLHQLRTEAAKASITPQAAAEWILERSGRNFFKADYFAPPAPAPAPAAPTAPATPAPKPAPTPALTAEQQAAQEASAAAARAKLKAMFAQPASAATPAPAQAASTLVVGKTGHAWADKAIAEALAGQPVSVRRLEMACQLAKVSYSDVRAAQKRAAAALAPA